MPHSLKIVSLLLYLVALRVAEGAVEGEGRAPTYLWPLGNTTVHHEVMKNHDAHLPEANQCFVFGPGYPGLPYDAITLGAPGAFLDFHLAGEVDFKDISLSFYIYPESSSAQGTLFSYKCATGNLIRLSVMQGLLFVSFWDEYGVSVGMTALPSLFNARAWNHLVLIRNFATGRIQIYHDGEIVEDLDDDFPNGIQLPTVGAMRMGKGHGDNDPGFRGLYGCFQFFDVVLTRDDVRNLPANCRPESWNVQPEVTLQMRDIGGEEKQCLTNYEPRVLFDPIDVQVKAVNCDVLGLHCLAGSVAWQTVMRKHKWEDSGKAVAYFRMVARGRVPKVPSTGEHLLGKVSTSDRRVCSRLCMRVQGCAAFATTSSNNNSVRPAAQGVECFLYDQVLDATENSDGTRYYALRADNNG